jgi:CubicO group peptidase (beta-lactamase class C family)
MADGHIGGMSPRRLGRVTAVLQRAVDRGEIAGVVALTHRRGHEAFFAALGDRDREAGRPMERDTIFRLASMTKPIVAAALLTAVEEGLIRLFDPVDEWLPELSRRQVMRDPDGPVDDVYPSPRPITLHDLLTFRMGLGWAPSTLRGRLFALTSSPLAETQSVPGATPLPPDAWMARLGEMPLIHEPGARWLYHTPADVAGVLLARLTGGTLEQALRERILEPLGMRDTGFSVPPEKLHRMAVLYGRGREGRLSVRDGGESTRWATPPVFESGGGGLVGTVDDFQRFGRMMLGRGALDGVRVLSRRTWEAMTTDHLTPEQRTHPFASFDRYDLDGSAMWTHRGFGYGLSVRTGRVGLGPSVGSLFWPGAFGTTWLADPSEELATTLLVQLVSTNPFFSRLGEDHVQATYQAIAD